MKIRGKNINMVDRRLMGESRHHYLKYLQEEYKKNFPYDEENDNILKYNYQMNRAVSKMEQKSYDFYYNEDGVNFKKPTIIETIKYAFTKTENSEKRIGKVKSFFGNIKNKLSDFLGSKSKPEEEIENEEIEDEEYLEENLPQEEYLEENLHEELPIEIKSVRPLTAEEQYKLNLKSLKEQLNETIKSSYIYMQETNEKFKKYEETLNRLREENLKLRKDYKTLAINSKCIIIKNNELEQKRKEQEEKINSLFDNYIANSINDYKNNDLKVKEISNEKVKVLTR